MGTTESSQSSELGQTFHRQSPNVARLIRSENSRSPQMEYEFPIGGNSSHSHHRRGLGFSSSSSHHSHQHHSQQNNNLTTNSNNLYQDGTLANSSKQSTDSVWLSFTSCFGCRSRHSQTPPSPLREKVHAIRIVRASNDLTPAVFDSHYNIITLEQLRECDQTGGNSGNNNDSINNSSNGQDNNTGGQNGNVHTSFSSNTSTSSHGGRMKKKKKRGNSSALPIGDEIISSSTDQNSSSTTTTATNRI
ncbi:unnamed protein product [Didymodactylos carnosus]|uniref:Uncharacterized protein n=1 Tax=Didymodactylos carnosus TaxID=1234261 RepID=A0A814PK27_9BILA|nr:unnamed protein product [Didymodactylos carnosus]CAF3871789.1 unnamed protein product [Didymodactylos carnosus]